MALYSTYVYTPIYLEQAWSVSTHSYGYISSICVLSLSGSVVFSRLSERYSCPKFVLFLCTSMYSVLFGLLWTESGAKLPPLLRMGIVTLLYGGSSAFAAAIPPILDDIVLKVLSGRVGFSKELFGRQRLWSSIGHAIIVAVNGWGIQSFGFTSMFLCMCVSSILFLLSLCLLHMPTYSPSQDDFSFNPSPVQESSAPSVWSLLMHSSFAFFSLGILIAGFVRCVVGTFGPIYFKKVLLMKEAYYGLAMQTRLVPEILLYFYGKEVSESYGNNMLMLIGQLSGIMRAAIYGAAPGGSHYSWIIYPAEMLKGINNASIMMAGPHMVYQYAPLGGAATALGIFHGVYSSVAMILAGLVGGQILQYMDDTAKGFRVLFLTTSLCGTLSVLAMLICSRRS